MFIYICVSPKRPGQLGLSTYTSLLFYFLHALHNQYYSVPAVPAVYRDMVSITPHPLYPVYRDMVSITPHPLYPVYRDMVSITPHPLYPVYREQ